MIGELWNDFPRLLERNIQGLLGEAYPNSVKAYQLYKSCQNEGLWSENFEKFSAHLENFFSASRSKSQRKKSDFDIYLNRPMDQDIFSQFHLNFRTGIVSETSLRNLANWAHNLMRVSKKSKSEVISLEVMIQTLRAITTPGPLDKTENIEFDDFCSAWKKIVFKFYGKKHDVELSTLLVELEEIHAASKANQENEILEKSVISSFGFTRVEAEWVAAVRLAAESRSAAPQFPSSKPPEKFRLRELDRIVSLYRIVQSTQLPELLKHRENIRVTILDRCETLMGLKVA